MRGRALENKKVERGGSYVRHYYVGTYTYIHMTDAAECIKSLDVLYKYATRMITKEDIHTEGHMYIHIIHTQRHREHAHEGNIA